MNKMLLECKAILHAENNGIVNYTLDNNSMVYYVSYPQYLRNKRYTIKVSINLNTMKETRKQLKRYNKVGEFNR